MNDLELRDACKASQHGWSAYRLESAGIDPNCWVGFYEPDHRQTDHLASSNHAAACALLGEGRRCEHDDETRTWWWSGWSGVAVQVFDADGKVTECGEILRGILERLESYPVLDDDDRSQREYDDAVECITDTICPSRVSRPVAEVLAPLVASGMTDLGRELPSSDGGGRGRESDVLDVLDGLIGEDCSEERDELHDTLGLLREAMGNAVDTLRPHLERLERETRDPAEARAVRTLFGLASSAEEPVNGW
jgi:hypothetical protein